MTPYPNWQSEHPFRMPLNVQRKVARMSERALREALEREQELRGKYEWIVLAVRSGVDFEEAVKQAGVEYLIGAPDA